MFINVLHCSLSYSLKHIYLRVYLLILDVVVLRCVAGALLLYVNNALLVLVLQAFDSCLPHTHTHTHTHARTQSRTDARALDPSILPLFEAPAEGFFWNIPEFDSRVRFLVLHVCEACLLEVHFQSNGIESHSE
jgi:hypothetical protein